MSHWEGLEEIVAIADTGSFIGAARRLGRSSSHVSRAVAYLETRLHTELFLRTTRNVRLASAQLSLIAPPLSPFDRADALVDVAHVLATDLAAGHLITRQRLSGAMTLRHGATDATGAWSLRDAYDALELAQVLSLLGAPSLDGVSAAETLSALERQTNALPTQAYRSERQVDLQQFSTPAPLAWLATLAAAVRPDDLVLEPSAGTGLLAMFARRTGARLVLNERDPQRAALLHRAFAITVSEHDAAAIDDHLPPEVRPTVVLINPPFTRSEGRGRDRHAGARHLHSALQRLAPGGRCVAILSGAFAPDGSAAAGYNAVAALVQPRFELTLTGATFRKHGTNVQVRLLIFDKGWSGRTEHHAAATHPEALAALLLVPPRLDDGDLPPASSQIPQARPRAFPPPYARLAAAAGGLFSSVGRQSARAPAPSPMLRTEPVPVQYEILDTPAPAGDQIGIYVPWRLSRMTFAAPHPHPDQLVESIAMSSITPPAPHYVPLLPPYAIAALSDAQLETLVYAGQAFERDLPGLHAPNGPGTLLTPHAEGKAYRMGFLLGDGTGVGKGQQVAGCILDLWCRGQRRAVWLSKSAALIEDARRDWAALGGVPIDIQPLDAFAVGAPITMSSGILFATYATLRSQRHDAASRLSQILSWLGDDFDGLVVFDEAHELANAAGTDTRFGSQKGSEQGLAGVRLQNLLPRARILYTSATGATDPANLCYAIRLGLWGSGTAFETREAFMSAIAGGGIAAMEIVARDLKALGLYTARALTFQCVDYDPLEHILTIEQTAIYDAYADAWAIIHQDLDAVLEATNIVDRIGGRALNAQAKGSALSRFESAKQRFFGQLLLALKLPTVIAEIERECAAGHHVIVQLVTTAESLLDRRLSALPADERADLEIELSPREYMIDYLKTAFPTRMMRVFIGTDDEPRSELMVDEGGNPVHSQEALRARDALIEQLCGMPPIPTALDALIGHFGTEAVAEITGRSRRLVIDAAGRQRVEPRGARANIADADAFMAGTKQILVFSDAGGTGRSYHADRTCGSAERRRVHFLLEPGWRAATAIQGLGRSNRTNQLTAPIFRPVTTNCRGERRFISTIARRLDSLGALTRGQRQTGGQNLFDPADNLESDYAQDALTQWYHLLYRGKLTSTSLADFIKMTGLKLVDQNSGGLLDDLPPIQRFLNRLLALRIDTQNVIFDEYLALIEARIDAAREAGTFDVGVETIVAERVQLIEEQCLRRDPVTGAETLLSRLELHRRRSATSFSRAMASWSESPVTFLRNERSGRVALRVPSWPILDDDGVALPVWRLVRPTGSERLRAAVLAESHWHEIDAEACARSWAMECDEAASRIEIETINIATGLLLPVWNKLPDDDLRVWRIADAAGAAILGRIVSPSGLEKIAKAFDVTMAINLPCLQSTTVHHPRSSPFTGTERGGGEGWFVGVGPVDPPPLQRRYAMLTTASTPVTAPFKVDISRGRNVSRVSSEWFSRPDDERFLSLSDLHARVRARADAARTRVVESRALRVEARSDAPERLNLIVPGDDAPIAPTNWSFGQLCSLVGAPASYLRTLPAALR